jgi:hypothetical protein
MIRKGEDLDCNKLVIINVAFLVKADNNIN